MYENRALYRQHRNESIIMQSIFHRKWICIVKNRNESCFLMYKQRTVYTLHNAMPKQSEWMCKCKEKGARTTRWFTWDFVTACACACEWDWRRKNQSISHWFDNICSNKCFITSRSYTKCKADLAAGFTTGCVTSIFVRCFVATRSPLTTRTAYLIIFNLITKINTHTHSIHCPNI